MPFNTNIYNINWKRLVVWLLPTLLRRPFLVKWLMVLITPVIKLHNQFTAFRKAVIYRLLITPQIPFLEKALNDRWDSTQRRIYITDPPRKPPRFIYQKAEQKPLFIYRKSEGKPTFIYTKAERNGIGVDFIINVTSAVSFNTNEMIAFVNQFKLASKRYKIRVI